MKVAACILVYYQVSPEDYQKSRRTFIFDSAQTLDEMLEIAGTKDPCALNLSRVEEEYPK